MNFTSFILGFYRGKGLYMFASIIITKLLSLAITFIAIRLILKEDFGYISYASSIISFIVPFMGMGAFQGLLRFGAQYSDNKDKLILFNYSLKKGTFYTLLLVFVLYFLAPFLFTKLPESYKYFQILIFQIIGLTLFEFMKSYFRLIHKNHLYAIWDIIYYVVLLIVTIILIELYGSFGYVFSLVIVPFIMSVTILLKYKIITITKTPLPHNIKSKEFWTYGIVVSVGAVSSQILYITDIFMLGYLLNDGSLVAEYKVAGLVPLSLRFLPYIFIRTNYILFAENSKNRSFLSSYFSNYLKLYGVLSFIILLFFYFSSGYWWIVFGKSYADIDKLIWIFALSISAGLILRIPLGNILTATSWAHYNAYVSIGTVIINVIFNYIFIIKYGILGAAWASALVMWISGIVLLVLFKFYLSKQTNGKSKEIMEGI